MHLAVRGDPVRFSVRIIDDRGGIIYQEIHRVIVQFPYCGEYKAVGSLELHWQNQHGLDVGGRKQW